MDRVHPSTHPPYLVSANPSRNPEVGVAFCTGGRYAHTVPPNPRTDFLTDTTPQGFSFLIFGLILFFDRALLAMGNILFLIGITLLLGPARTFAFFARKQKWRGSAAFWVGILLILVRWTLVGFVVECYGIFVLFGE